MDHEWEIADQGGDVCWICQLCGKVSCDPPYPGHLAPCNVLAEIHKLKRKYFLYDNDLEKLLEAFRGCSSVCEVLENLFRNGILKEDPMVSDIWWIFYGEDL